MFRPMRRASRAIPEEAAKHLLQQSRRGVLAVNGDNGYPFAIPVNYYYDQEHDKIYFHGAKSDQKVDALKQNDKVCFTVYGNEHFEPGDWAPYVQSTVVFGRCHLIDDAAATEARVRELGMKYYPGKEEVKRKLHWTSRPCSFTRSPLNTSPANRSRKSKNKTGDCCKIKMR